jgi:GAF domain-containing protein
VATPSPSPPRPGRPEIGLTEDLIALAGTPDDDSSVPALLRSITQLAVDLLPPVTYASVTVHDKGSYTTVAMSSEVALAVDEAQYADNAGPCLDALRTSDPTAVPRIDTTMKWPGFRAAARRLGLRASLSIPLFAGRGTSIAALNLYGQDTGAMAPLSTAVLAIFESSSDDNAEPGLDDLGPGALQLVTGLVAAFGVRAQIQQALGVIMASERTSADFAYAILRSRAAATTSTLTAAAGSVLGRAGDEQRPV